MVVIATNNGYLYLKELLNSMKDVDFCDEQILIVDTMSDDETHLKFLKQINILYPKLDIIIANTPYRRFDTGAYIYAYKNYESDNYIFLHDSITIIDNNFIKDVKEYLKNNEVVAYNCFEFAGMGDTEWKEFFKINTGEEKYKMGIFGPMFACNKRTLDKINLDTLQLPQTKNQQACFEGIWYTIFEKNNIEVFSMDLFTNSFNSKYLDKKIIHRN